MIKVYYSFSGDYSETDFEAMCKYLPKEKAEKMQRIKNIKVKNESVLAWYLLYVALSDRGIKEYSVSFGENGKPYFTELPLFFNLSHTDNFVCCAVGEREVGVDAEKIKSVKEGVIKKVLTENERNTLKDTDADFIRYWTLKESILKHCGSGITPEIYGLDFSAFAEKESFSFNSLFFTVKKKDKYYISVCGDEKDVEFIKVKP